MKIEDQIRKTAELAAELGARKALESAPVVPEYLGTKAAAEFLSVSHQYLEIARCRGYGPPYSKLARAVRYTRSDLDAWMAERQRNQISQEN